MIKTSALFTTKFFLKVYVCFDLPQITYPSNLTLSTKIVKCSNLTQKSHTL